MARAVSRSRMMISWRCISGLGGGSSCCGREEGASAIPIVKSTASLFMRLRLHKKSQPSAGAPQKKYTSVRRVSPRVRPHNKHRGLAANDTGTRKSRDEGCVIAYIMSGDECGSGGETSVECGAARIPAVRDDFASRGVQYVSGVFPDAAGGAGDLEQLREHARGAARRGGGTLRGPAAGKPPDDDGLSAGARGASVALGPAGMQRDTACGIPGDEAADGRDPDYSCRPGQAFVLGKTVSGIPAVAGDAGSVSGGGAAHGVWIAAAEMGDSGIRAVRAGQRI